LIDVAAAAAAAGWIVKAQLLDEHLRRDSSVLGHAPHILLGQAFA
jgi:hypothetical protein